MTFELLTPTKGKLLDLEVLSQKNREPNENVGVKLSLKSTLSNHALAMFNGQMKSFLWTKAGAAKPVVTRSKDSETPPLDGVEPVSDLPNLSALGTGIGRFQWHQDLTGYTFTLRIGTATDRSNVVLSDCKLDSWKMLPKEGGSVEIDFNLEAGNCPPAAFAKLCMFKSREIEFTLEPPEVQQEEIDDKAPAGKSKGKADGKAPPALPKAPVKSATDQFIERHAGH